MLDPINNPEEWRKYHLGIDDGKKKKSSFFSQDDDFDISVALSGIDMNPSTVRVYDFSTPKGRVFVEVWPGGHIKIDKSQL